ncbi:hypothetical protein ZWY2020_058621 [Hordeum vulgare]|nr:hypothetical protein ZWY2020_058621 [Hordeum vulgare]
MHAWPIRLPKGTEARPPRGTFRGPDSGCFGATRELGGEAKGMAGAPRKKMVGRYEVGWTIGHGAFGKVKFAVDADTGVPLTMKVLDKATILNHRDAATVAAPLSSLDPSTSVLPTSTNPNQTPQTPAASSVFLKLEMVALCR